MKNFINKKLISLGKKILKKYKIQKKNILSAKILINYLIYLNLKVEKLLLKKNVNPETKILKDIEYLYTLIEQINMFQEFGGKKIKNSKF